MGRDPGSYYKMGSDWDGGQFDDHLPLKLKKMVKGVVSI